MFTAKYIEKDQLLRGEMVKKFGSVYDAFRSGRKMLDDFEVLAEYLEVDDIEQLRKALDAEIEVWENDYSDRYPRAGHKDYQLWE